MLTISSKFSPCNSPQIIIVYWMTESHSLQWLSEWQHFSPPFATGHYLRPNDKKSRSLTITWMARTCASFQSSLGVLYNLNDPFLFSQDVIYSISYIKATDYHHRLNDKCHSLWWWSEWPYHTCVMGVVCVFMLHLLTATDITVDWMTKESQSWVILWMAVTNKCHSL